MKTLPDTSRSAGGGSGADDALLRAIADMPPGWTVLRNCALADGDQGARARVRYALLHPDVGVALLDVLPGATTPGAPDRLRRLLDAAGFRSAFGDYPPVVYLCVPLRSLFGLDALLAREFDLLPPLALSGGGAWVGAVQGVLTAEPPLRVPGPMAAEGPLFPNRAPGWGWRVPQPNLGLRGLAMFWGVVTLAFGGGALLLQGLGPPEGSSAVAHAGGAGPSAPQGPQPTQEVWPAPPHADKARLPSPGPILALWPAERMPTRFDAARAGADAPDAEGGDPHRSGDRSAPAATPDRPQKPPALSAPVEAHPGSAAGMAAGVKGAGANAWAASTSLDPASTGGTALPAEEAGKPGAPASAAADALSPVPRAFRPDVPAPAENGNGSSEAPAASTMGSGAAASATVPNSGEAARTGTAGDQGGRGGLSREAAPPAMAAPEATRPAASPMGAVSGAPNTALRPREGSSAQRSAPPAGFSPAENEASPAAAGTSALTGTGLAPSAAASEAGGNGGAAARAAELDAPPAPHPAAGPPAEAVASPGVADASPSAADLRAPAHADPQSTQTRAGSTGVGVPLRADAIEPAEVAGAAPLEAPPGIIEPATTRGEGTALGPLPAAGVGATEPSAEPGEAAPRSATAPPGRSSPDDGGTPAAPPSAPSTPARAAVALDAAPVLGTGEPVTAPPPRAAPSATLGTTEAEGPPPTIDPVATSRAPVEGAADRSGTAPPPATHRDTGPGDGPPPVRNANPTPPGASAPVARPALPEPDNRAAARAGDTDRRAPAAVSVPPALVDALIARGDAMVARRDISAARLLYERAAAAGEGRAASALARTYDPAYLAEIGALGIRGDVALASAWYQKALSLGDASALARVEALNGADRAGQRRP